MAGVVAAGTAHVLLPTPLTLVRLIRTEIVSSPTRAGRVRLCGEVAYDDARLAPERYWLDVAEEYANDLTTSGNPWLAILLPLAVMMREPLRLSAPVDPVLLDGATELQHLWAFWHPPASPVPIEAPEAPAPEPRGGGRAAAFFSGGVDSFFTVLNRERLGIERPAARVDELIVVHGFDVPLSDGAAFERMFAQLGAAADRLGKPLLDVATNLRETSWAKAPWGLMAHGAALAGVALALERRFRAVCIASSNDYGHLRPWGSHPMSDRLFSTSHLRIVHDGAGFSRMDKMRLIAESPVALQALHVCWRSRSDQNCGACEKCYRTMTALAILGVLDQCATFSPGAFDVARIGDMYCTTTYVLKNAEAMHRAALDAGRRDIAGRLEQCLRRSRRLNRILPVLHRLAEQPLLWRATAPLEQALLRGMLR